MSDENAGETVESATPTHSRVVSLYRAAQQFFTATTPAAVCEAGIAAARDVLAFSHCGVYLYDRATATLEPAVTVGASEILGREPSSYTDKETVVWETYRSEAVTTIENTRTTGESLPNPETNARSAMIFPLGGHGVLLASSMEPAAFSTADEHLGELLSGMLRVAIDRAKHQQAVQRIQKETHRLTQQASVETICTTLIESVVETLNFPFVGIWKHDPVGNQLRPVACSEEAKAIVGTVPELDATNSLSWDVFHRQEVEIIHNLQTNDAIDNEPVFDSEIVAPIGTFGVVITGSRLTNDFTTTEADVVQTLAQAAHTAISVARQHEGLTMMGEVLGRVLRHNVRNDLTLIRGHTELLAGESSRHTDPIRETCDSLIRTVRATADIQQVILNRSRSKQLAVGPAVRSAARSVNADHDDTDFTIELQTAAETRETVTAHPNVELAVQHAIENGVIHSDAETPSVTVTVTQMDAFTRITVRDDGPGIESNELEPLRANTRTDLMHTSGVGLWIIDRVASYSGGTASFSTGDRGTRVTLELPNGPPIDETNQRSGHPSGE